MVGQCSSHLQLRSVVATVLTLHATVNDGQFTAYKIGGLI